VSFGKPKTQGAPQQARIRLNRCREIALELNDAAKIHQVIEAKTVVRTVKLDGYVPPQSESEHKLCLIWQNLLHIERVGVRDNFFELGGHSLLAVRMFAEIERTFNRKLPLVTLFQSSTVRELAKALDQSEGPGSRSLIVPLQPHGGNLLSSWCMEQEEMFCGLRKRGRSSASRPTIYGIKSRGQTGQEEFTRIEDMAAWYVKEVRAFQPEGPYYLGGYCLAAMWPTKWRGNYARRANKLHCWRYWTALRPMPATKR